MTRPVDLALVGCGRLAEAGYLPALAGTTGVRVVAVADPDPDRRAHVAARAGRDGRPVPAHADLDALLAAGTVDGVVLASPAAAHVADARAAVAAGVAVLVEKPPAPDAAGAAELARLAPPPWVGFNRRFDPGVRALRDQVPATGHVRLDLELHYRRRSWQPVTVHDDALVDLAPHAVDLARWLTGGEVVEVVAADVNPERCTVVLLLDRAVARVRLATDQPHHELVAVSDDRGRPVARHRLGGPVAMVRGRLPGGGPSALVTSLAGQLQAFATAVAGGPAPDLGTAADGVAVMDVIDAVRACARRQGRPTAVERTER